MAHYLLSLYQPDGPPPPPEILEPIMRDIAALQRRDQAAGAWVFAGGLHEPSTATVLRAQGDETLLTDGPFAEGKEHLGGFTIVRAPDLDAALDWGRKLAQRDRLPVEVRPFLGGRRLMPAAPDPDRRDRPHLPRGVRARGGRPGPRLRRHRHRRGSGAGGLRRGGRAVAGGRAAPEPGGLDHHHRPQPRDRPPPPRGDPRRPARRRPRCCTPTTSRPRRDRWATTACA